MVKQWQLYYLNLNPVIGSEQAGVRPCIVISADYTNGLNQVTVLPITSMKKSYTTIYPNEVFLPKEISKLPKDSLVLAHQMRTVDKQRLINFVSTLNDEQYIQQIRGTAKTITRCGNDRFIPQTGISMNKAAAFI